LGINIAWVPGITHMITYVAMYDFIKDFMERGTAATREFQERHMDNPYVSGQLKIGGAEVAKQRELEEKYLSAEALEKYQRAVGRGES
jgi:hypothetical protein